MSQESAVRLRPEYRDYGVTTFALAALRAKVGGGGENRTPVRTGVTTASTCVSDLLISLQRLPTVRPPL